MKLFNRYRFGFDIWGLVLFLIIMVPNFIWFIFPAPNDILRADSITKTLDIITSLSQVLMIAALCVVINDTRDRHIKKSYFITICIMIISYIIGWYFYYLGITTPLVIMDLCLAPSIVFILFSISRKNWLALIPTIVFTICHTLFGYINFIA